MARTKVFNEKEVLNKAMELFWNKGYNGTSAQDLVDYLGLSRSSLYDTFGDKHSLFIKALEMYRYENEEFLKQKMSAGSVKQAFKDILEMAVRQSLEESFKIGCFMVNSTIDLAPHDEEVAKMVNSNRVSVEAIFSNAIKRAQKEGEISSAKDAGALASFIFNAYSGIRVGARSGSIGLKEYNNIVKIVLETLE